MSSEGFSVNQLLRLQHQHLHEYYSGNSGLVTSLAGEA